MTQTFGIVGLGRMGQRHLRAFEAAGLRFGGFVDPAVASLAHRPNGAGARFANATTLAHNVDIVVVATPSELHASALLALRETDAFLFAEKPVCTTKEDLAALSPLAKSPRIAIGHSERFHPGARALRGRAEAALRATFRRLGPMKRRDVHPLLELGTHDLDLAGWLFGPLALSGADRSQGLFSLDLTTPLGIGVSVASGTSDRTTERSVVLSTERGEEHFALLRISEDQGAGETGLVGQARAVAAMARGLASDVATLGEGLAAVRLALEAIDRAEFAENLFEIAPSC